MKSNHATVHGALCVAVHIEYISTVLLIKTTWCNISTSLCWNLRERQKGEFRLFVILLKVPNKGRHG